MTKHLIKPIKQTNFAISIFKNICQRLKHTSEPNSYSTGSHQRMKYMQLVEYINNQIETNQLNINDKLPSINQLIKTLSISKETALKGLNYLSQKGIIESEYRKGYYVKKKSLDHTYRVCMILDKMNVLRDRVYHSFLETIKNHADVDVYFHHHNFKVFEKLVEENLSNYTHFVVITFFKESPTEILNRIPAHKRILLDLQEKDLEGEYTSIYQDHKADILDCLTELLPQLKKYKRMVLVSPLEAFHAEHMIQGFEIFCKNNNKNYIIVNSVEEAGSKKNDAYVTFSRYDQDDISVIKLARANNWQLGKDIGLISYNDTAVKEVLENGITVISTDFNKMGKEAAKAILSKQTTSLRDTATVILRNSL